MVFSIVFKWHFETEINEKSELKIDTNISLYDNI